MTGHIDFFRATVPLGPPGFLNAGTYMLFTYYYSSSLHITFHDIPSNYIMYLYYSCRTGQYQFGFKLQLPDSLPPSFTHSWGGDRGSVKYIARARVDKSGFDWKTEQEFAVIPRPTPTDLRPVGNASQQNVTMCCCCNQGTAFIQINIDKDRFTRGEAINVAVQARNSTQKDFGSIDLKLKRMMALSSSYSTYSTRRVKETPVTVHGQGLSAGQNCEAGMARRMTVQVPADCPPSVNGRLVQCYYAIEASLESSLLSSVVTQVPIAITLGPAVAAQPSSGPPAVPPPGWNPQVFPTVNIPQPPATQPPPMPNAPPSQQPPTTLPQSDSFYHPPAVPSYQGPAPIV